MLRKIVAIVLLLTCPALAADWPHWRGPAFNGSSPETNLPTKFSTTENVKWVADLPGDSASTPIIVGDNVFVSSINSDDELIAMCFDRGSGEQKWTHKVGHGPATDRRANKAAPSPTTDGKIVVFFYGTGDMAAFSVEGKKLWQRSITQDYGDFSFLWTFSSSPTFYGGAVYLPVLQRNSPVNGKGKRGAESFILKIDPADGKTLKRQVRPSKAEAESLEAFTTIIPHGGQLILAGGDCLTGHDPETLEEIWRWGTWNPTRIGHWRLVPSAVAGGGVVLACAPKSDPVYAVRDDLKGDHSGKDPQWKSEDREISSDVSTPAFYNGRFYIVNGERRVITCVEPKTGEFVWNRRLTDRNIYRASPAAADGKIYVMSHSGQVSVYDAKNGELLHDVLMAPEGADHLRSSIAIAGGNLFIKVQKKLYCIGNEVATD